MAKSRERDSNRAVSEAESNSPVDCYGARERVDERCESSESLNRIHPNGWIFFWVKAERDSNKAVSEAESNSPVEHATRAGKSGLCFP